MVSEALWCGLPVVAFDDQKGVRDQVDHERDGLLLPAGPDLEAADQTFASSVLELLEDESRRARMSEHATRRARERCAPSRSVDAWQGALLSARAHCERALPEAMPLSALAPLARWYSMHCMMVASGYLRPKATLNRHKRGQPRRHSLELKPQLA